MNQIRIIGVPRSGTNYTKYLIETSSKIRCGFNVGWWKHLIVPAIMSENSIENDNILTIILYRYPLDQIISFYKFSRMGRGAIQGNPDTLKEFILDPVYMEPHHFNKYRFDNPVSYWLQFYYAALNWSAPKLFVNLDELRKDPLILLNELTAQTGNVTSFNESDPNFQLYMGRNIDKPVDSGWNFEEGTTFKQEQKNNNDLKANISNNESDYILTDDVMFTYEQMEKTSIFNVK